MSALTPDQYDWLARPLLDAGLGHDRVRGLFFQLCFEAITSDGEGNVANVVGVVRDEPAAVQAAWDDVVGRMIAMHRDASAS